MLSGWSYKQEIIISSVYILIDYPIKIELNKDNFDFSLANSDGSDIRFTLLDDTLLDYWIESWDNTLKKAIIWVKVPSIQYKTKIYIQYGNDDASSTSNGSNVFDFFDDFESYTVDTDINGQGGWETKRIGGSGEAKVRLANGRKHLKLHSTSEGTVVAHALTAERDKAIRLYEFASDWNENLVISFNNGILSGSDFTNDYQAGIWGFSGGTTKIIRFKNSTTTDLATTTGETDLNNIYHLIEFSWDSNGYLKLLRDDSLLLHAYDKTFDKFSYIGLLDWSGATRYIDWILVRKIKDIEPTVKLGKICESTLGGTINISSTPVENATIRCFNQTDGEYLGEVYSDSSGQFLIDVPKNKEYHVFVEYDDGSNKYNAKSVYAVGDITEPGWLGTWKYRRKITINKNTLQNSLRHFPLLIKLGSSVGLNSTDVTDIFDELGSNYKKIAITKDDGITQLYAEVELWDSTNEVAYIWVSKDDFVISNVDDTVLYLYYDSTQSDNTSYIGDIGSSVSQNVWDSGFVGVWHMVDNTTSSILDSTSNANNGTKKSSGDPYEADGLVGKAQYFDGDAYIDCGDNSILKVTTGTIEAIFKLNSTSGVQYIGGIPYSTSWSSPYVGFQLHTNSVNMYYSLNINGTNREYASGYLNTTDWIYACHTYDGRVNKAYFNDKISYELTKYPGTISYSGSPKFAIGVRNIGGLGEYLTGYVDEIRFSNIVRDYNWIKATYLTINDILNIFSDREEL